MKPISLSEVAQRSGGLAVGECSIFRFATDSRDVTDGTLFLAIKGNRADGHDFVPKLVDQGIRFATLAERQVPGNAVIVPDLVEAVAKFGSSFRQTFHGPVVGVTGSAGKTTTKEFAAAALSSLGPVLKSPGNKNTEYTSPLVWAEVDEHRAAVMELAMRGPGQIEHLAAVHRPHIAIVTNIGTAHIEMVGSREGIAQAKAEIFAYMEGDGIAVLWKEDLYADTLRRRAPGLVVTFGFEEGADARIVGYRPLDWTHSEVLLQIDGATHRTTLPIVGRHQALNAAAGALAAVVAGARAESAVADLAAADMPPMRMEIGRIGGVTVVLDTYNANPSSTIAALQTLGELPAAGRKLVVLGSMKELGEYNETGHREVGRALAVTAADRAILFGEETEVLRREAIRTGMPESRISVASDIEEVRRFVQEAKDGDVILIKGSRSLELERAVPTGSMA
ncbi:MAG: UDP-N-acetylmuramoyl-tripeptide--D-alanyl-D-alanine ligase [Fimbriimonadaceae bacterium]|nr:UDP-N-acetylmuramoyl-tripeptide--D-alanyl-D-alanine ligase [Fimbriimonadaceae bacterium]